MQPSFASWPIGILPEHPARRREPQFMASAELMRIDSDCILTSEKSSSKYNATHSSPILVKVCTSHLLLTYPAMKAQNLRSCCRRVWEAKRLALKTVWIPCSPFQRFSRSVDHLERQASTMQRGARRGKRKLRDVASLTAGMRWIDTARQLNRR